MHICVVNLNHGDVCYSKWCDRVVTNDKGHLVGYCNGSWLFESTSIQAMSLSKSGIKLLTRSGNTYLVTTPGKKAMKKLFKSLIP